MNVMLLPLRWLCFLTLWQLEVTVSTKFNISACARMKDIFDRYQIQCRSLLPCTMAMNNESNTCSSQNGAAALVIVELDENDIPGAAFNTKRVHLQR